MRDARTNFEQVYTAVHDKCYNTRTASLRIVQALEQRVYRVADTAIDAAIFSAVYAALSKIKSQLGRGPHAE
jgi:hypothetical protein